VITAVRSVELRVDDLDAARAFYERVVGLEPEGDSLRASSAAPLVHLRADGVTARAPRRAAGLFHTAFRFPTRADLADALRRAAPYLTGASDHGVSEALYLDDPDGNGVELYWDRPRNQWPPPTQPGEKVGMFTIALDLQDLLATPDADSLVDIGHVHLKVADVERAVDFWTGSMGLELMTRYGADAAFVAADGYHHHVGLNQWLSAGADPGPRDLPGLERVVLRDPSASEDRTVTDPDGNQILVQAV
jgi:catechol 2,3-dioxygenase